jgi:hypothetical protein
MAHAAMINLAVDKGGRARGQLGVIREPRGGASRLDFRGEMEGWAGGAFAARDRQKMTRIGAFKAVVKAIKNDAS